MALNKDGLEQGQAVDYATLIRVTKEQKSPKEKPSKQIKAPSK